MHQQLISPDEIRTAASITHSFSNTRKMPCPSWGISARRCQSGSIIRKTPGTACSKCYAMKGHYFYPNVAEAQEKRYQGWLEPGWVKAMAIQIHLTGNRHFRWFDSGDLQSASHFSDIREIALLTPDVKHWLPTMEYRWIVKWANHLPDNLTVRLSSPKIGKKRATKKVPISMIKEVHDDYEWHKLVHEFSNIQHFHCPSSLQDDKCQQCRACWDKKIQTIVYRQH